MILLHYSQDSDQYCTTIVRSRGIQTQMLNDIGTVRPPEIVFALSMEVSG